MPTTLPQDNRDSTGRRGKLGWTDRRFAAWTLVVPCIVIASMTGLPAALALPAIAVLAVTFGLLLAVWNGLLQLDRGTQSDKSRDVTAALLLIGFAASMMSDVPDALRAFAELQGSMRGRVAIE